jgi:glycogen(starch) synthase
MEARQLAPAVGPSPTNVLVVSSWLPAAGDPAHGRFVADQVVALRATGKIAVVVASFDLVSIAGDGDLARRTRRALVTSSRTAVAVHPAVLGPGTGLDPDVPVARLPIPIGDASVGLVPQPDRDRARVLEALALRLEPTPSLIHAHGGDPDGAGSAILAHRLGRPLVITEHASFVPQLLADPLSRRRYLAAVRNAVRIVAVSETLASELRAAIPDLARKLIVIPNVVAIDDFPSGDPAARRPGELLYAGYRKDTKGIATLLQAFASVRRARPDARLRLIGRASSDAEDARWRELVATLEVDDAVSFEPVADRAVIGRAMRQADLFVHPSPRETFGVVAAEALASGLPVVAADSGGVTEIIGGRAELGAIFPAGNPAAFASAILDALVRRESFDPSLMRSAIVARYSPAVVAARLVELYREVLSEATARGSDGQGRTGRSAPRARPPYGAIRMADPPAMESPRSGRIVLAFAPGRGAKRLSKLPEPVRSRLDVLAGSSRRQPPSGLRSITFVDLEAPYHAAIAAAGWRRPPRSPVPRVAWLVRHPIATLKRLVLARRRASLRIEGARRALDEAVATYPGPPEVVCIEAYDYLIAEPRVKSGAVVLAPGGIRWLGDR